MMKCVGNKSRTKNMKRVEKWILLMYYIDAGSKHAGVAQLAERPPCKRQVVGSKPILGSTRHTKTGKPVEGLMAPGILTDIVGAGCNRGRFRVLFLAKAGLGGCREDDEAWPLPT